MYFGSALNLRETGRNGEAVYGDRDVPNGVLNRTGTV